MDEIITLMKNQGGSTVLDYHLSNELQESLRETGIGVSTPNDYICTRCKQMAYCFNGCGADDKHGETLQGGTIIWFPNGTYFQ